MIEVDKDKKEEYLQRAIAIECVTEECLGYLISLIRNGKIRERFKSFVSQAKTNQELLKEKLLNLGDVNIREAPRCDLCKVSPASFSLVGAIDLGLEIIEAAIKNYSCLLEISSDASNKRLYKKLIKEKLEQKNILKKEKKFNRDEEGKDNILDKFCIPEIVARLWK